jgi:hypothetical protein
MMDQEITLVPTTYALQMPAPHVEKGQMAADVVPQALLAQMDFASVPPR